MHGATITSDDEAGKWLRQNDPYYSSNRRNKRKQTSHPYDTPYQGRYKFRKEIPFSALCGKALRQATAAGVDSCLVNLRDDDEF